MILFKLLLIILISAPVIAIAAVLFIQARKYVMKKNRQDKYKQYFDEKNNRRNYY